MTSLKPTLLLQTLLLLATLQNINTIEDGYLRYVKDGCFLRGEALSCVKYKAVKIAKKAIFGDSLNKNETIKANNIVSLVPLDDETIERLGIKETKEANVVQTNEARSFLSEWAELAKYFMKLVQEFFKVKGLKVNLPEGARTVEEEEDDNDIENNDGDKTKAKSIQKREIGSKSARGKKKKLAVIVPLLTLFAVLKLKLLLIPILLSVLLIKKVLLIAALLLPSVLSTLKACKQHHHPMSYSYFGASDTSDYSAADYNNNNYAYSASGGYGKDWASNRAYNLMKHRPTPSPSYITAPGAVA